MYSPGGATLFDLVTDDDMRVAATGCWPAACSIKTGSKVGRLRLPCFPLYVTGIHVASVPSGEVGEFPRPELGLRVHRTVLMCVG